MIHILSNISRSKSNHTTKFGQLIECNMRNIFLEKTYTKSGGGTLTHVKIPRWGTSQNFLLAFIDKLWKTQKLRILKWKKKLLRYGGIEWDKFCLSFWAIFCPLPPNPSPLFKPENQNFEKMKNTSGDAIILNCATENMIKWCVLTQIWSAISF